MPSSPAIGVIIAAAGSGARCGGDAKQWRRLPGGSVVELSWRTFAPASLAAAGQQHHVAWVGLAVDEAHRYQACTLAQSQVLPTVIVTGGKTRMQSVGNALERIPGGIGLIAVHDAVRPFWPLPCWDRLIDAIISGGADGAILAVPAADTLKSEQGGALSTVDRRGLWVAQTPQVFRGEILREAHRRAGVDGVAATDDAALVERVGGRVEIVTSTTTNLKITTPEDWILAERFAMFREEAPVPRIGIGLDTHRLGSDKPLLLGGVKLADRGGLIGHSDGDALLHAVCDALLGAAALGDIGRHFPPDEPAWAGVDSRVLLRRTVGVLAQAGYCPYQVDAVVMTEAPRLAPHVDMMRHNIAADLGIDPSLVSVKAKTGEKMGFVGRGEGIAAQAVATIIAQRADSAGGQT